MLPDTRATIHTFPNGLKVILDVHSDAPVISTQAWVETGSIHEGKWMGAGISHLLEHMVFKGTASFSGEALSQEVQAAGGQWNAYTTFDRTVYYIDGPASSTELFLKALTEMVFKPTFPEEEFEKERDVIRREIDMGLDDPDNVASRQLFSTALANDGRSQPVIGHLELFNHITHEDMVAYHHARYTPENTFLCISGDFDQEALLEALRELVNDIPRRFTPPVSPATEPVQLGKRVQRSTFAIPASKLTLAWQAPDLSHPDAAALELLSNILGGGRSSRLYQNLREQKKLCLHIGSWAWITPQPRGLFSIHAEVTPELRDTLEASIYEEIHALTTNLLEEELEKAKRVCLVSQLKTLITASGRASDLASNWHEARNLHFTQDYLNHIESITVDDLKRVCTTYLTQQKTLTVTSLDPQQAPRKTSSKTPRRTQKDITQHTLSNGLELFMHTDPKLPMVSLHSASLGGVVTETKQTAGINTLLSTLLTKGKQNRSGSDIAVTLETLGASLSASSGNNTFSMGASCLSQDIDTTLDLFGDIFAHPTFDQKAIDFEKEAQRTALLEQQEDPLSLAFQTLRGHLFDHAGYGISKLGTEDSLTCITRENLQQQHQQFYTAQNTKLAVFGDIDPEKLIELAESRLKHIPSGKRFTPSTQPIKNGEEIALSLDKQQAVLALGYTGASVHSEDIYALDLLHAWCSDMAGPLFTKIREELGLAYYCSATQFHGHDTGFFGFYLGTSPDQLSKAKQALQETIQRLTTERMSEKTLDAVKASWLSNQALSNQSNSAMARLCSINTLFGLPPTHYQDSIQRIKAILTDDLLDTAQKYFGEQEPTIVTVAP